MPPNTSVHFCPIIKAFLNRGTSSVFLFLLSFAILNLKNDWRKNDLLNAISASKKYETFFLFFFKKTEARPDC